MYKDPWENKSVSRKNKQNYNFYSNLRLKFGEFLVFNAADAPKTLPIRKKNTYLPRYYICHWQTINCWKNIILTVPMAGKSPGIWKKCKKLINCLHWKNLTNVLANSLSALCEHRKKCFWVALYFMKTVLVSVHV